MRSWRYYAVRCLQVFLLVAASLPAYGGVARAADSSEARVTITSDTCVVDVVNNGNNQTLQSSSACAFILPNLLTAVPGGIQHPILPFAGINAPGQVTVRPDGSSNVPERSLTSEQETGTISQPAMRLVAVITGVSATLIVTIIGIDIALFELRLTRYLMQGVSARNPVRLIKK